MDQLIITSEQEEAHYGSYSFEVPDEAITEYVSDEEYYERKEEGRK